MRMGIAKLQLECADLENLDDVRMLKLGNCFRLSPKPFAEFRSRQRFPTKRLDCNAAIQFLVLSFINNSHSPASNDRDDFIAAKARESILGDRRDWRGIDNL